MLSRVQGVQGFAGMMSETLHLAYWCRAWDVAARA